MLRQIRWSHETINDSKGPLTMVRRQVGKIAQLCFENSSVTRATTNSIHSITGRGNVFKVASAAPISVLQRRGIVMPAQEESYEPLENPGPDFTQAALNTYIDRVGAVSVISEDGDPIREGLFQNRDGHRFEDGRYAAFTKVISTSEIFLLLSLANQRAMRLS